MAAWSVVPVQPVAPMPMVVPPAPTRARRGHEGHARNNHRRHQDEDRHNASSFVPVEDDATPVAGRRAPSGPAGPAQPLIDGRQVVDEGGGAPGEVLDRCSGEDNFGPLAAGDVHGDPLGVERPGARHEHDVPATTTVEHFRSGNDGHVVEDASERGDLRPGKAQGG